MYSRKLQYMLRIRVLQLGVPNIRFPVAPSHYMIHYTELCHIRPVRTNLPQNMTDPWIRYNTHCLAGEMRYTIHYIESFRNWFAHMSLPQNSTPVPLIRYNTRCLMVWTHYKNNLAG